MNELNLYADALKLAQEAKQTIGDKNDYYITLEQLMIIISKNL